MCGVKLRVELPPLLLLLLLNLGLPRSAPHKTVPSIAKVAEIKTIHVVFQFRFMCIPFLLVVSGANPR